MQAACPASLAFHASCTPQIRVWLARPPPPPLPALAGKLRPSAQGSVGSRRQHGEAARGRPRDAAADPGPRTAACSAAAAAAAAAAACCRRALRSCPAAPGAPHDSADAAHAQQDQPHVCGLVSARGGGEAVRMRLCAHPHVFDASLCPMLAPNAAPSPPCPLAAIAWTGRSMVRISSQQRGRGQRWAAAGNVQWVVLPLEHRSARTPASGGPAPPASSLRRLRQVTALFS